MALSLDTHKADPELNVLRMKECRKDLGSCKRCKLSKGRNNLVFGAGNPSAPILIVNGPPSWHEDNTGIPLAGRSGSIVKQALTSVGLKASRDIFCTNLVKCRPPLDPVKDTMIKVMPEHVKSCGAHFDWQKDIVKPAIIVIHGKFANQTLLGDQRALGQYVGTFRKFSDKTIALSTHNPAGLFGDRATLIEEYLLHWRQLALRLQLLGKLWRPDAKCFKDNWNYKE